MARFVEVVIEGAVSFAPHNAALSARVEWDRSNEVQTDDILQAMLNAAAGMKAALMPVGLQLAFVGNTMYGVMGPAAMVSSSWKPPLPLPLPPPTTTPRWWRRRAPSPVGKLPRFDIRNDLLLECRLHGPDRADPPPWWHAQPPGAVASRESVEARRRAGEIDWPEVYAWNDAVEAERSRTAHREAVAAARRLPAPASKARLGGGQRRGRACSADGRWRTAS